jgi:hypothetical protein
MTTSKERLQILNMIEQGQISPEEGAKLLSTLSKAAPSPPTPPAPVRWFRVRVTDLNTGRNKININIPAGLVDVGLRMGARFVPASAEVDLQEIADKIHSGQQGKIFESINEQDGEHVEIFLE